MLRSAPYSEFCAASWRRFGANPAAKVPNWSYEILGIGRFYRSRGGKVQGAGCASTHWKLNNLYQNQRP